jgi:LacI family transcriptional regulator
MPIDNTEPAESEIPTIYTVAERAGVSIATVSRALSGGSHVRPETRERVRRAAAELGWQPPHARRIESGTTRTLALVFPDVDGPFYAEVVRAVEIAAGEHGYHVAIYGTRARGDNHLLAIWRLLAKIDGMIVMTTALTDDEIRKVHQRGVPLVLLSHAARIPSVDVILTMNREGAHLATVHFLEHGYKRIALIAGPLDSPDASEREDGYRQALREHGVPIEEELLVRGDFRQPGGYQAMNQLLQLAQPPRAVFAANDEMAFGALEAIKAHGLRIPEDIAIIGFDDIPLAAHLRPSLTTVRQPVRDFARVAVERLVTRLAGGGGSPETLVLPAILVIRRSCGCRPADSLEGGGNKPAAM